MTAVLGALAAGVVAGLAGWDRRVPAWVWDVAGRWALRVLLALMGLRLGLDPQVGAGWGLLGGRAAVFALATAGGSMLAGLAWAGLAGVAARATGAATPGTRGDRATTPAPSATAGAAGAAPAGAATACASAEGAAAAAPAGAAAEGAAGTAPAGAAAEGAAAAAPAGVAAEATEGAVPAAAAGDPAAPPAPDRATGRAEAYRLSAAAVLAVAAGWAAGWLLTAAAAGLPPGQGAPGEGAGSALARAAREWAGAAAGYALVVLMALYGREFGHHWPRARASLRALRWHALVLPLAGAAGSLAGGWLAGWLTGEPHRLALAVAAAFGWYSMAGVLVAQLWGPAAGALAFLANVLRELLTVIAVPLLAGRLGPGRRWLLVLPGGATTMDTTLPVIAAAARDAGTTALAFVHGLALTALAPALIAWLGGR